MKTIKYLTLERKEKYKLNLTVDLKNIDKNQKRQNWCLQMMDILRVGKRDNYLFCW